MNQRMAVLTVGLGLGIMPSVRGQVVRLTLSGDANLNGRVELDDLHAVMSNFGRSDGVSWAEGDFNFDSVVNAPDLMVLKANWGADLPYAPPLIPSAFAIRFKGAAAAVPISLSEVPISAGAIMDDPALTNARCYRIGFTLPAGVDFTCAGLNVQLSTGSFYNEEASTNTGFGGIVASNPSLWNTPGRRQLAYDTFVTSALPGTFETHVAGHFPETFGRVISTSNHFSAAWGDTNVNQLVAGIDPGPNGSLYIAQLTVIGTTLSASAILPEPSSCAAALLCPALVRRRRFRRTSPSYFARP